MYCDFQTTTYGKWILTGEHTVIRGGAALVFPIKEKHLHFSYQAGAELKITYAGSSGADFALLFNPVLEYALGCLEKSDDKITGHFHWDANLPVGQGMGASAALCVALTRWLVAQQYLDAKDYFDFAKELEHCFHGKSSGLDIAGVSADSGLYFEKGQSSVIKMAWQPQWYLSSCELTGVTLESVKKVETLHEQNPILALQLDEQMKSSVKQAKTALETQTFNNKSILISAINTAKACFEQWGLVNEALQKHMLDLTAKGALAVKPTGSGGGGYVISLWDSLPPSDLELIGV
jgi:mevalonate kinase